MGSLETQLCHRTSCTDSAALPLIDNDTRWALNSRVLLCDHDSSFVTCLLSQLNLKFSCWREMCSVMRFCRARPRIVCMRVDDFVQLIGFSKLSAVIVENWWGTTRDPPHHRDQSRQMPKKLSSRHKTFQERIMGMDMKWLKTSLLCLYLARQRP